MFLPLLLPLRLFVLSVGCCLPGKQEGLQRERAAERQAEKETACCFILAALLWEPQTHCEEVDLGSGHRSAHPWIISSKGDCYFHSTRHFQLGGGGGVNPQAPTAGSLAQSGPTGDREAERESKLVLVFVCFVLFFCFFFYPFPSLTFIFLLACMYLTVCHWCCCSAHCRRDVGG